MSTNPVGLFRLMSYDERQEVERELAISFDDIYGALDTAHAEARELEMLLNRFFHGESRG
jgi:class 3 adenylate cyclase